MSRFIEKLRMVFSDENLMKRIAFTLGLLVVTRLLAIIPIPGIDTSRLQSFFANNDFLNFFNIFSGGGLSSLSIVMLGVSPYITASIIMQLMPVMLPKVKSMLHDEGEAGRRKFAQWTRLFTVPLALVQGYAFIALLQRQGVLPDLPTAALIIDLIVIVAGSMLITWIGELITEFGVGNGVSLIIFAGIVAVLPSTVSQLIFTFDPSQAPVYLAGLVVAILVTLGVVVITEAERPIPITYAKQVRGNSTSGGINTYLPLRLNPTGVIPIIFALSILLFPQMILQYLSETSISAVNNFSAAALSFLANPWSYAILYFVLVFVFTYFYTAVTIDPEQMAENLQKGGAFVPGVRPGASTEEYVSKIISRLTLVAALFLGIVAILPLILRAVTGIQSLAIGGTALLIVVAVVLDLMKKIDAQVSAKEY